jgi:hypothetical protein
MTDSAPRGALLLGACWFAVACGDGGEAGSTAGFVSREDFPRAYTGAVCGLLPACCSATDYPVDEASCNVNYRSVVDAILRVTPASHYRYDGAAAGSCVAAMREASAGAACAWSAFRDIPCDGALVGTLLPGAPCTTALECAPGRPGDEVACRSGPEKDDLCYIERRGAAGEPCTSTCRDTAGIDCTPGDITQFVQGRCFLEDGLTCSTAGGCVPVSSSGGACDTSSSCATDHYCDSITSTCAARLPEGSVCDGGDECGQGLFCLGTTCAPKGDVGMPCDGMEACLDSVCVRGTCTRMDLGLEILCALASLGI